MSKHTSSEKLLKSFVKDKKKRISLYVSEKVYGDFQKKCKNIPVSNVIEKLMQEFINN